MLEKVKLALRIKTSVFDSELEDLIAAAVADLGIAGIKNKDGDPLITRAVITYCRCHFGEPEDPIRLKTSYDEQKAQLITCTGYGLREETDGQV